MKPQKPEAMSDLMPCADLKPMVQDKVVLRPTKTLNKQRQQQKQQQKQAEFYFSDSFIPHLNEEGPVRYCREDVEKYELKKLRRGDYFPQLILDLHGLNQEMAKLEILALFKECKKQRIECCSIVHGIGTGVLKTRTPYWLAQYPELLAFHQAPRKWGGQGALLVLLDIEEHEFDGPG